MNVSSRPVLLIGAIAGLAIGFVDSRPGWDATGISAVSLLVSAALLGLIAPKVWLASGVAVGLPALLLNAMSHGDLRAFPAIVVSLVGAAAGGGIGRAMAPPQRPQPPRPRPVSVPAIPEHPTALHTLEELASIEAQVCASVASVLGSIEEKSEQLEERGVFEAYEAVFVAYLRLLDQPGSRLEALKRALFVGWYSFAEPASFSGIGDLPPAGWQRVQKELDACCARRELDRELEWMLPYYHRRAGFAFGFLDRAPSLAAFLEGSDPEADVPSDLRPSDFEGRGQMGIYWRSIAKSHPRFPVDR